MEKPRSSHSPAEGIGRATAQLLQLLAEHGALVVISALDGDAAERTAAEISGETAVFTGDLTGEGSADRLVRTAIDAWGSSTSWSTTRATPSTRPCTGMGTTPSGE